MAGSRSLRHAARRSPTRAGEGLMLGLRTTKAARGAVSLFRLALRGDKPVIGVGSGQPEGIQRSDGESGRAEPTTQPNFEIEREERRSVPSPLVGEGQG